MTSCPFDTFDTIKRLSFDHCNAQIFQWPSVGDVFVKETRDDEIWHAACVTGAPKLLRRGILILRRQR